MPFDYAAILDALERAADVAWLEERDREDREEVAATATDPAPDEIMADWTEENE